MTAFEQIAAYLSVAASIKDLMTIYAYDPMMAWNAYAKESKTPEIEAIINDPSSKPTILSLTIIDSDLLRELIEDAHDCLDLHRTSLADGITPKQRDEADLDADRCMCEVLNRIKKYNGGELPADTVLHRWWVSYRCL